MTSGAPRPMPDGTSSRRMLLGQDREVADDVVVVEPHVNTRRAGAIGGKAGVSQPAVKVVVAATEGRSLVT